MIYSFLCWLEIDNIVGGNIWKVVAKESDWRSDSQEFSKRKEESQNEKKNAGKQTEKTSHHKGFVSKHSPGMSRGLHSYYPGVSE